MPGDPPRVANSSALFQGSIRVQYAVRAQPVIAVQRRIVIRWGLETQGLGRALIQAPCDLVQVSLRMPGQVGEAYRWTESRADPPPRQNRAVLLREACALSAQRLLITWRFEDLTGLRRLTPPPLRLVRSGHRPDAERAFGFVKGNRTAHRVVRLCETPGVSTGGFDACLVRPPSAHQRRDEELSTRIKTFHVGARETYGRPRVHVELRDVHGERVRSRRVARLTRQNGLEGASRRKKHQTTGATKTPGPRRIWSSVSSRRTLRTSRGLPTSRQDGRLRFHRRLVQPSEATFVTGLQVARRVRDAKPAGRIAAQPTTVHGEGLTPR